MSLIALSHRSSGHTSSRTLGLTGFFLGGIILLHLVVESAHVTGAAAALLGFAIAASLAHNHRSPSIPFASRCVTCYAPGCSDIQQSPTLDLSARGFFIQTDAPYPVLTRFEFELRLPGVDVPISGIGVVRWINRITPQGMGCEIVRLDHPEQMALLNERTHERPLVRRLARVASVMRTGERRQTIG